MQQLVNQSSRKKKRIHSIAALDKLNLNFTEGMTKSKQMKSFYLNQQQVTGADKQKIREQRITKSVDKMQGSINQMIKMIEVKQNKEKYLQMRLDQILAKQDQNIIKLKSKIEGLKHTFRQKNKQIEDLRRKLKTINQESSVRGYCGKIAESKYYVVGNDGKNKSQRKRTKVYTTPIESRVRHEPVSPFSSQPTDLSY